MFLEKNSEKEIVEYADLYNRFHIKNIIDLDNQIKSATNNRVNFINVLDHLISQSYDYSDDLSRKKFLKVKTFYNLFLKLKN